jgi:hypothetical protein
MQPPASSCVALIAAGPPAFLDDAAERSLDEIPGIFFAEKLDLAFKSELEEGRRHARSVGRVRGLLDKLREVALDRVGVGLHALLVGRDFLVEGGDGIDGGLRRLLCEPPMDFSLTIFMVVIASAAG